MTAGDRVWYAPDDGAGLGRRLAILLIDAAVILGFWAGPAVLVNAAAIPISIEEFFPAWFVVTFAYLTALEASPVGSIGFMICGTKIVTLRGERPSVWRMTGRLLICLFLPLSFPIDLLWLAGDDRRQSLRDKIAGTYVIRKAAAPAGRGPTRGDVDVLGGHADLLGSPAGGPGDQPATCRTFSRCVGIAVSPCRRPVRPALANRPSGPPAGPRFRTPPPPTASRS